MASTYLEADLPPLVRLGEMVDARARGALGATETVAMTALEDRFGLLPKAHRAGGGLPGRNLHERARHDDPVARWQRQRRHLLRDWILDAPKYTSYLDYVKYAVLTRLADDPPDPNFTALASPPKLRGLRGAPPQVGQRDRREAALYIALLTSVERAAGAEAAGATTAQSAQLRHASGIANQLVSLLGAKQKALKAAARTVKRIRAGRLSRSVVPRAKRRLDPRSLTPALRKLGFTADEIAAVRQSAPSVPLKRLTAPFQTVLGLGAEARTVGAERAALANFAKRHGLGK